MEIYRFTDDIREKKLYLFKDIENIQDYIFLNIFNHSIAIIDTSNTIDVVKDYIVKGIVIKAKISKEEVLKMVEECLNKQIDYINSLNE